MPSLIGNKPNQVPSNGDLGTLAFHDANAVNITGGAINGTTIGATTPSTGAFTSLSSSTTTILNGTTLPASKTLVTTTDTQTLTNKTLTGAVVDRITDNQGGVLAPISSVMRNRIINGAMVIDQRNAGASVNGNAFPVDRFQVIVSQSSKLTAQQNAGSVTPPAGFRNYLGVTSSSAYGVISSDFFAVRQFIEGFNIADLGWGTANAATVTLSFWVRSSLTGAFGGALQNSAQTRAYPYSYTISAANTWEYKTITIAGDTTGTWLTNNGQGIGLYFSLGTGSASLGTAGAWAASSALAPTGATSVVGTNGATFYITGVQLERGTQATSFEYRQYGQELALCQRYAEVMNVVAVSHVFTLNSAQYTHLFYKETKRAVPTYSVLSGAWQVATPTVPSLNREMARPETAVTAFFSNTDVNVLFNAEL